MSQLYLYYNNLPTNLTLYTKKDLEENLILINKILYQLLYTYLSIIIGRRHLPITHMNKNVLNVGRLVIYTYLG